MKVIIFVHTCKLYEESRAKLIEQTWGNRDDVIFVTDNKNSKLKNFIFLGEGLHIYHPINTTKVFNIFLTKYSDFDFFMIIDDDSYLYIEKLKLYLTFFDKNDTYMIGDFLNWIAPRQETNFTCDYNRWASGGPGFVFTKKCIEKFLHLSKTKKIRYISHDVWLHNLFMLSDKKIKRVHCPGFYQYQSKELLNKYSKEDNQIISVHLEGNMYLINDYHI
jgi:hypothetical protein